MGGLEARGTKKYLRTGASVRPSHLKNGIIIKKKKQKEAKGKKKNKHKNLEPSQNGFSKLRGSSSLLFPLSCNDC